MSALCEPARHLYGLVLMPHPELGRGTTPSFSSQQPMGKARRARSSHINDVTRRPAHTSYTSACSSRGLGLAKAHNHKLGPDGSCMPPSQSSWGHLLGLPSSIPTQATASQASTCASSPTYTMVLDMYFERERCAMYMICVPQPELGR